MRPDRGGDQVEGAGAVRACGHAGVIEERRQGNSSGAVEGKKVSPISEPCLLELNKLPRWIGQLSDLDLPEPLTSFFACL